MHEFLEARCSWEPGSRLTTGFLTPFRLLPNVSHANNLWAIVYHTFFFYKLAMSPYFLMWHKPLLSPRSRARARNPKGISKLVIKGWLLLVLWQLLDDSQVRFTLDHIPVGSLHFAQCNSVGLPCYEILCSGFLKVPLPIGMRLKVSP